MIVLVLALSYWIHLLATAVWLGGLAFTVLVALPALKQQTLNGNQWLSLQSRLMPWVNGSLVLLLLTGFVQMTNDANYTGFLQVDSLWTWAMLLKHIVFGGMAAVTAYLQWGLYPEMERLQLLLEKRPQLASEMEVLQQTERRLLWINVGCAALVLLFTAVLTAL